MAKQRRPGHASEQKTHLALYRKHAASYERLGRKGTFFIAFRELDRILKSFVSGRKALDFGCGSGRSTRYLREKGFDVVGVDISKSQINEARRSDPEGNYFATRRDLKGLEKRIPPHSRDVVLANIVFPEMRSREEMVRTLNRMKRFLKLSGKIIIITLTPEAYKHNWASYHGAHAENVGKQSGERVKLTVSGTDMVFYDYCWHPEDYQQAFEQAGLRVVHEVKPLGKRSERIPYVTETKKPFWHIFVLEPKPITRRK